MGRTNVSTDIARELETRIKQAEGKKRKILSYINHIKNQCVRREITYPEYEKLLNKKTDEKTLPEWVEHYDDYIQTCKEKSKKHKIRKRAKKTFNIFIITSIILMILLSVSFLRPTFMGLTIEGEPEFQTQIFDIKSDLKINESAIHTITITEGQLKSLKLSGEINGEGSVKIYLEDFLVIDSSKIQEEKLKTSKITAFSIEGAEESVPESAPAETPSVPEPSSTSYSEEEVPQLRTSPSEGEPLPETSEESTNPEASEEIIEETPEEISEDDLTPEESGVLDEETTEETLDPEEIIEPTPEETTNETTEEIIEPTPETTPSEETKKDVKKFTDLCEETCNLPEEFNKTTYELKIEITNAELILKNIKYEILTIKPPITKEEIPEFNVSQINITGVNVTEVNVSQINITGVNVTEVNVTEVNLTSEILNESLTTKKRITLGQPVQWTKTVQTDKPGKIKVQLPKQAVNITVNKIVGKIKKELENPSSTSYSEEEVPQLRTSPSEGEPQSSEQSEETTNPETSEELSKGKLNPQETAGVLGTETSEEPTQSFEQITEPAKSTITGLSISETSSKKSIAGKIWNFIKNSLSRITGRVVTEITTNESIEVTIDDNATEYEIEYYTKAPQAFENNISEFKKQITISAPDELNYTDILAYTELPTESAIGSVRLYHLVNGSKQQVEITEYDSNNNSLTDYIEWNVPHLSNQTYELEIIILNVKSHPTVGGNWTVEFNTTGIANLTITAYNGTNWSNTEETYDLKFLEIKCGNQTLDSQWIENSSDSSVLIEDYECNGTGFEISKVLTQGFHTLEFDFGGTKAYAYNTAGKLSLTMYGSINGYNSSVNLKTIDAANSGYDIYDIQSSPPPTNYSEFYSNITDGSEYHLVVDSWNDTANPRELYLIYYLTVAQTGTIEFYWDALIENYTGNFTYYEGDDTYTTAVAEVDMRSSLTYSDAITSEQYLYAKVIIDEYNGPAINITYPIDANYSSLTLDLNYTFNSTYPDSCWYSTDSGDTNSSPQACGTNWTGISASGGSNTWMVYINDTSGALNTSVVTFNVDATYPDINIIFPINNTTYTDYGIEINYTFSETSPGTCWWTNNTGTNNYSLNPCGTNVTGKTWGPGENIIEVYINDTIGNENSSSVTFTINNVPQITYVSALPNINPNEAGKRDVQFNLTITDTEGVGDINNNSVNVSFSKTGEATRANTSCSATNGEATATSQNFSCTVDMWYWDGDGTWDISVYGEDNSGTSATNSSTNFVYNLLNSITISPSTIFWSSVSQGAANQIPDTGNFTIITNTGNFNGTGNMSINAINFYGPGEYTIDAGNFTADIDSGAGACDGVVLQNATDVNLTNIVLERGNSSLGINNATLYYCLDVPSTIASGSYGTAQGQGWTIKIIVSVSLIYASTKKKKKKLKKLKKDNLVVSLNLITTELREEFTEEKQNIAKLLIKEIKNRYNLTNPQISKLTTTPKTIPLNIFSTKLGALEAITKYLKENINLPYIQIAKLLNRNQKTIWTAYHKSQQKHPTALTIKEQQIPIQIFKNKKLTILEALILHLRKQNLKYIEISELLNRDQRNIWTIYSRTKEKLKGNKS